MAQSSREPPLMKPTIKGAMQRLVNGGRCSGIGDNCRSVSGLRELNCPYTNHRCRTDNVREACVQILTEEADEGKDF